MDGGNAEFEVEDVMVVEGLGKAYWEFQFANNRRVRFVHLSSGHKRLFSIVLDIAYRSFILNGTCVSSGVVIIDEIDLNLHPAWNKRW